MGETTENAVLGALAAVVRDHGGAVESNPARLRAMLSDVLGATADEHRGAVDALVIAAEEGVARDVRSTGGAGVPAIHADLVGRLEAWGLTTDRARWTVDAWAGVASETTTQAGPLPVTEAASTLAGTFPEPSTLPAADLPTRFPVASPTTLPAPAGPAPDATVTELPPASVTPASATSRRRGGSTRTLVIAATACFVLAGAGLAGVLAMASDDDPEGDPSASATTGGPSAGGPSETSTPDAGPAPAEGTELVAAPAVRPVTASDTIAMASRTVGVQVTRLSEVDEIVTASGVRAAPDGGSLVAFRLANWKCDVRKCHTWSDLDLHVAVGSDRRALPKGDGTYVVAVPADTDDVELVMKTNGQRQTLSLVTGEPGPTNIAVLGREDRVAKIDAHVQVDEHYSREFRWPDGGGRSDVVRNAEIRTASLHYFMMEKEPRSPKRAFLWVDADYTRPYGDDTAYVFRPGEIKLRDHEGVVHKARDLDPSAGVHTVFDVPADIRRATLIISGIRHDTVGGEPFSVTLDPVTIPIRFS